MPWRARRMAMARREPTHDNPGRAHRGELVTSLALLVVVLVATLAPAGVHAAGSVWVVSGSLATARVGTAATRLSDGRVLVAGGAPLASAGSSGEVYDPALDAWTSAGSLGEPRVDAVLVALDAGRALLT